ncbi:PAS domain S-box protein [bacterium]|nr:PAS domain S-box protein [bacterium]
MRFEELREQILQALAEDRPLRRHILTMFSRFRSQVGHYRRSASRLRTLLRMSAELQAIDNIDEQLNLICNVIVNIKTYHRAIITLLDDDLSVLGYGHAGLSPDEEAELKNATPLTPKERRKILDKRYQISHSYFIPYTETEKIFDRKVGINSHHTDDEFVNWHPQDMLFVPLYGPRKRLVGTLSLDDPVSGRRPSVRSLKLLELFGSVAAAIIAGDRLYRKLEHAKRYLTNLVENSADMIIATDTKGRILLFNRASEQLLGYTVGEIIGERASKLYTDVEDFHAIEQALRTNGFISGFETTATTKSHFRRIFSLILMVSSSAQKGFAKTSASSGRSIAS